MNARTGTETDVRPRASRRRRVRGRQARLRDRDIEILLALAKMRLLRTSDLSRLFFGAVGTCQKRMRKLYDAGLVRTIVTDLAAENRFVISPLGCALLERVVDSGELPDARPPPKTAGSLAHLELLNQYRIALAVGGRESGASLVRFVPEWDLRAGQPAAPVVPDAVVVLQVGGRTIRFALEVDVGSEPAGLVRRKFDKYAEQALLGAAVFGLHSPAVLLVASSTRRARTLARALRGAARDVRVVLAAVPFVLADGGTTSGCSAVDMLADSKGPLGASAFRLSLAEAMLPAPAHTRRALSPIRALR